MGDLKPIGSEKLQGDDKIKRILELAYYNQKSTNNKNSRSAELVKESTNGVYGIVREKDGYYVKKGLNEQTLDYIGGMFMKNKNRFTSYAEALKRLELLKSQELNEEVTKYILKPNKPKEEAPTSVEPLDAPALPPTESVPTEMPPMEPSAETSAEGPGAEPEAASDFGPESSPEGGSMESGKRSDYMAEVQKFAGKLGQELRDQQPKMESDDIKYVLNMVISAVDLDKLEDDDIEEIGKKFERDEEASVEPGAEEAPEVDAEEPSDEEPAPTPEDDLAERISKLEELVNTKLGDDEEVELGEIDLDMGESEDGMVYDFGEENEPEEKELPLDELDITPELSEINENINTTLSKYFE